jgi:hypothetical protein
MANYGQQIDDYNPSHDHIYDIFTKFLNDPTLYKVKDQDNCSVYMVKTYCLLSNECRYIVAIVNKDFNQKGAGELLKNMRWISLQTRTLQPKHSLQSHSYTAIRGTELDAEINRINKNMEASTYKCDKLPIIITMLHGDKGINVFQDKGTVATALETYQTIITFVSK